MMNWSDTKSVYSISSKSEASTLAISRTRAKNAPLHERCSIFDMVKIKEAFTVANKGKLLSSEFRDMLRTVLNVDYDDEEYKLLFLKINTSRNGEVDWDEFVSHLILGYFGNDPENQRGSLELPILGLPTVLRSQHRHPISRILFLPAVSKERTVDPLQGNYMTVSRDGMINWWTLGMHLQRTAYSSSPHLKVKSTWVTDMVVLPDVNIVVTSSTERDLRFYDCAAGTFTLKIVIYSWEYMICSMCYHFTQDENEPCMLICGDVGGYIRLLTFSPIKRGPFQNQAGKVLVQLRHKDLKRKSNPLPGLKLIEYPRAHAEWIRQVAFYSSLHYIVTCATCPDSLLMCDLTGGTKTYNMFHVDKGIQCFAFDEDVHVLATGGPDCTVRIWNPFVPTKPSVTFQGHHAGIMSLVIQEHGRRVYSLSRDRVIKVWDVQGQSCIQTYIDIPAVIGERTPITAVYNHATREYILAAMMIAVLVLDEQLNPLHTDGFTHSKAVSKVLYNPLFKVVVTCGLDSIIINWDPITGKRNMMVRDAHTRLLHGELIPVEITAATFDPGFQLLLTGARNGTLRVWNFNTGVCLRNMSIEHMCEVTGVFWVDGRILAIGWNRHVTEFDDSGTSERGKSWEVRHTDDVLAAAARPPLAIVTGSYNSELLMWKLETGQPYRQFSCTDPMLRIKMHYSKKDLARATASQDKPDKDKSTAAMRRRSSTSGLRRPSMVQRESSIEPAEAIAKARARRVSQVALPGDLRAMRRLAIHAMLFLETRPQTSQDCSLLVALENGRIQCWSDHPAGGFKGSFQGVHTAGDYVSAMATDVNNDYVFTGTTVGYIKVWLMTNYLTTLEPVHISMPKLRLQFPFLWYDRIEGRAKRCVRDQPLPLLLNSYRAHLRCITSVAYVDEHKLVLSGSSDYSVRLWRLSGEYLQTLGSFVPWTLEVTRFPPDVKKVASFTTFKVWRHGEVSRYTPGQVEVDKLRDITEKELKTKTFGAPPDEPLLGHYFKLPRRPDRQDPIKLDDALPTIPIYAHLRMASTQPVKRPPTPELVKATRLRQTVQARRTHFDPNRPSVVDQSYPAADADKDKDEKDEGAKDARDGAKKSS